MGTKLKHALEVPVFVEPYRRTVRRQNVQKHSSAMKKLRGGQLPNERIEEQRGYADPSVFTHDAEAENVGNGRLGTKVHGEKVLVFFVQRVGGLDFGDDEPNDAAVLDGGQSVETLLVGDGVEPTLGVLHGEPVFAERFHLYRRKNTKRTLVRIHLHLQG
jgi:hypothetical protein